MVQSNVLLREDTPSLRVRVRAGFAVRACDDHAPSAPAVFEAGEEIPNLAADEGLMLVAAGVVEVI